jgi:hypothetical protein
LQCHFSALSQIWGSPVPISLVAPHQTLIKVNGAFWKSLILWGDNLEKGENETAGENLATRNPAA